ncbi:hypothetical protein ZEAMMB73_Zm00001d007375 [Zea mays]|uniref:NADP-dependent oxidoreductase domain-containing protein n=1 Tax=Zea mays TaxID=4577 RepID=A0A1D6F5S5_MAIZE|nr:hypothetical protein ZEAMMB73_Zm00001d007375 [Zea mays]ONM26637.1 hypothetical protein ZEAMMB73_Zm00001d007375 [Zea mays]ONM26638.1 hypothetical protein ZEAMMB73_Zm00001d007375 [Zea mays]
MALPYGRLMLVVLKDRTRDTCAAKSGQWHKHSCSTRSWGTQTSSLVRSLLERCMTFGEQNTEKEAHDIIAYSFDQGVNILDTAEIYPVPMNKETQGRTDLYNGRWMQSKP